MLRVLMLPADEAGCGFYRMRLPAAATAGQVEVRFDDGLDLLTDDQGVVRDLIRPDVDVVVIQRPLDQRWQQVIPLLQSKGVAVVIDVDDRFDALHPRNAAYLAVHPRTSPAENFQHLAAACRVADLVVVSTPALVPVYGAHGRCLVLENCVPDALLELDLPDDGALGWPGWIGSHPDDLGVVGGAVATAVRDGWRFRVVGPADGVGKALGVAEFEATGFVPIDEYHRQVGSLATVIAPLADTAFNAAKSWLKPLEAMAVGTPVVCSDVPEYRRLVEAGAGVLCERPRDWTRALRVAADPLWQAEQAEAGRDVARRRAISRHAWRWVEVWSLAAARYQPRSVNTTNMAHTLNV